MHRARISIATVAFFVALLAVDCALVRVLTHGDDQDAKLVVRVVIMMANLLPIASWGLTRARHRYIPFLGGFSAFGLASVVVHVALFRWQSDLGFRYQYIVEEHVAGLAWSMFPAWIERDFFSSTPYALVVVYLFVIPAVAVTMALPQLIIALVGGLLVRRSVGTTKVLMP